MEKISRKICLIAFLVLVAASYMTEATAVQDANINGILNHLIHKRKHCSHSPRTDFPVQHTTGIK
jgi:hypothetical protein